MSTFIVFGDSVIMSDIIIQQNRPRIDELLAPYAAQIGGDLPGYRNHVYRAVTYAMHFLGNLPEHEQLVETAFVYHDIALWTNHALAYLEPSEAVALADNAKYGWGLNPDALQGAIHWHHKITAYRGPHEAVIEACRKADWIDANKGMVRKGMSRANIKAVEAAFPNLGFHDALVRLAKDNGGSTVGGLIKVVRGIVKW
jgi:hypothetical protein